MAHRVGVQPIPDGDGPSQWMSSGPSTPPIFLAKRMVRRPTSVPWLLVLLSFLFTTKVMDGPGWPLGMMGGGDAIPLGDSMSALVALSPYHVGGAMLSPAMGGSGTAPTWALVVPAVLIVVGLYLSRRLYPDVYGKG